MIKPVTKCEVMQPGLGCQDNHAQLQKLVGGSIPGRDVCPQVNAAFSNGAVGCGALAWAAMSALTPVLLGLGVLLADLA